MRALLLLSAAWAAGPDGQVEQGDRHYDLELLYHQRAFHEGAQRTALLLQADPTDTDLYWAQVRFLFEIAERFDRHDPTIDKEAHYLGMLDLAQRGLELAPDDAGLRFARGVAKARLGTTRGVLASLFMVHDIEQDWLYTANHPTYRYRSIDDVQVLPCDAYHGLGILYRMVPDAWLVGMLAGTRGDLDASLSWHQRAVACQPDDIKNHKELAATQLCMGHRRKDAAMTELGMTSLDTALSLAPMDDKESLDQIHAAALKADPTKACGYSRDGQQPEPPTP